MRLAVVLLCLALACGRAGAEPDAPRLGAAQGYPVGDATTWMREPYRVGSWSALDQVRGIEVRRVPAAAQVQPLARVAEPPPIRYRLGGADYTLQDYLEHQRATGLLVLQDGRIVAEHYRYGRQDDARFLSFSMAKSVTSLLVGIALERGVIGSLDDPAEKYAPALQGSAYGGTSIRQLLRMSSGLHFTERYDGHDDVARMARAFASEGTLGFLRGVSERDHPAGTVFHYAGAETEVLGRVLVGASGRSLAQLTSEWLWRPIGAERDAFWRIGGDGQEGASGYFGASLRDWARLGLLLARDGRVGERQVVPREYLLEATDPLRQPAASRPGRATPVLGYGYQFWLLPLKERTFAMLGIYGQAVYVQPASGIVMVVTSAWAQPSSAQDPAPARERYALWLGVLRSLAPHHKGTDSIAPAMRSDAAWNKGGKQ